MAAPLEPEISGSGLSLRVLPIGKPLRHMGSYGTIKRPCLSITDSIEAFLQDKLQPYEVKIAHDAAKASQLVSEFEASIHTPAMALVRCAEDVVHTLAEILPLDGATRESWALDLERLKDKLHTAVHYILQTLRAASNYHRYYSKANSWYTLTLGENFLQELLSGVQGDAASTRGQRNSWGAIPAWRYKLSSFLKKNPTPDMEELLHLAHLSNTIPDDELQQAGKQMSHRCLTLRKLLISSGPVAVGHLKLALQWQYELFQSGHIKKCSADGSTPITSKDVGLGLSEFNLSKCENDRTPAHLLGTPSTSTVSGMLLVEGNPPFLNSFDSGFDGAGSSPLESLGGREEVDHLSRSGGIRDSVRSALSQHEFHKNISSFSDCVDHSEEFGLGSVGNSSRADIHIAPKVTVDTFNFEIKGKRSAALPNNPWLSLPVEDLENSYTVTVKQNLTPQKGGVNFHDSSNFCVSADQDNWSQDWHPQMEVLSSVDPRGAQSRDWIPNSQNGLEDPELSPIHNILSSTITEDEEKSVYATDGNPTLLWDSYDLHDQNLDDDGVSDIILKDWDVKEQESLKEVEKILVRADEILSMSSSELGEAGVLSLEDCSGPSESDSHNELALDELASEAKASGLDEFYTEAVEEPDGGSFNSRPELLEELKKVQRLDELILEENLKIHKLKHSNKSPQNELMGSYPLDTNGESISMEREVFRLQLEKEKREVEILEKNLDKELNHKEDSDKSIEAVPCSTMEKSRKDKEGLWFEGTATEQGCTSRDDLDGWGAITGICKPELSVTPEVKPDDGAFDPGGKSRLPPIPKPRRVSLPMNNYLKLESPHSTEVQEPAPSLVGQATEFAQLKMQDKAPEALSENVPPDIGHCLVLSPHVKEQTNNNNNHTLSVNPEMTDFNVSIVLDTGSGLIKGFADQDLPNGFPSIIGIPKYEEVMNGNFDREMYIGQDAQNMRGVLALKHPIKNGIIRNWDEMEKIWHYTFQQLGVDPEDHPVLLTEAAMNPRENRERMVEIMFESFSVPLTYVAMQAVLALYAAGRTTGVVFESGAGVSHSVPVFDGYCLPHAVQRFPLAGADVTMHLKKLLQEQGVCLRTTAEEEIVREMKEKCCCVALDYEAELRQGGSSSREMLYTMPDGQIVTLSTERFRAPEILFKPELIGRDHHGMHKSIYKSVVGSDIDLRGSFLKNIILSGGNTLLPGLPERLQAEIKGLLPVDTRARVRVTSPTGRDFSVWSGGAVFASLPNINWAWIDREEYEEYGPQIVLRKCF
ncbi:LOW QUALITY PROTEIN: uncharacterized protein KZ484_024613 [Pholidichthys leucotaenia]